MTQDHTSKLCEPTLWEAAVAANSGSLKQWNILRDVQLSGRLDPGRLRASLAHTAALHPMTRAHRVVAQAGVWHWQIESDISEAALGLIATESHDAEAVLREVQEERLLATASPAFRCILIRGPADDRLLFGFCHERTDGIGAMAFLRSLQLAYAGELDPARDIDWIARRHLETFAGGPSACPGLIQPEPIEHLVRDTAGPLRSATHSVNIGLSAVEATAMKQACRDGETITHRVIAAVSLACDWWNRAHGRNPGRICIGVPVNARPASRRHQGFFNAFGTVFINTGPAERATMDVAARSVAAQARHTVPVAIASATGWSRLAGPTAIIRPGSGAAPPASLIPTAGVSSLGLVDLGPFGNAARAVSVWAPPYPQEPLAVAVGVLGLQGEIFLSFRFASSMVSLAGGQAFAQQVRLLLLQAASESTFTTKVQCA